MNPAEFLRQVRETGWRELPEDRAKELLESIGIDTARCHRVASLEEAQNVASSLGSAVVLKLCSPRFLHKTDAGGVELNLTTPQEVGNAYSRLEAIARRLDPGAVVVVQEMAKPGLELIVGVTRDSHFGAVVMLGLGGIFTEVLKDITYRLLPINEEDAADMIASLKGYPLLAGSRGREPVDLEAVKALLLKISRLVTDHPDIREVEINPVVVYPRGLLVLDARMVLDTE